MSDGNVLSDMSEEIVRDVFGMDVLDSNVHVQTGLDVIYWNVRLLEIISCTSHAVRNGLVSGWHPTSLYLCHLFGIAKFFLQLSSHVSNRLHSLLGNWIEISSRNVWWIDGRNRPDSSIVILLEALLVNARVICIFFILRMLDQCWGKIWSIVVDWSLTIELLDCFFIQQMVFLLV